MRMPSNSTLEAWRNISGIFAGVAVPLLVGFFGWWVQASVAEQAVKKDYVHMALGVLTGVPNEETKALRSWAIAIVDKNAPVPMTTHLKDLLASRAVISDWGSFVKFGPMSGEVVCRDVPDARTRQWLLDSFPLFFVPCPGDRIGERRWLWPSPTGGNSGQPAPRQ